MKLSCYFRPLLAALAVAFVCSHSALAQKKDSAFDPFTASIEENITLPAVSAKQSPAVVSAMAHLMKTLKSAGYSATAVRSGEVVMVSVPCSELFSSNATELKEAGARRLQGLLPYVKRSDNYKVVIAVHADNTGDAQYADELTAARATAIDEYFFKHMGQETGIIPYGLGFDEPVAPNAGVKNRAANRRVEIYFVPTKDFIAKAQKK